MFGLGPVELLILMIMWGGFATLLVLPFWFIFSKAGFPGWYSLGFLVPVLNIVMPFILAFSVWPALAGKSEYIPVAD